MQVENALWPSPEQALAFFGAPEDGPFVMVNLLKFRPFATYADGSDPQLTGAQAYGRYGIEVAKLVLALGGRIRFSGDVTGILLGSAAPLWDAVALAEYPSLAAMRDMASSAAYRAIEHHRDAGLEGQLNIRTKMRFDGF